MKLLEAICYYWRRERLRITIPYGRHPPPQNSHVSALSRPKGAWSSRKPIKEWELWQAISSDRFLEMSEDKCIDLIRDEFPQALAQLKRAYAVSVADVLHPESSSISERLYNGKNYDEINRTLLRVLALRWIVRKDYASFICSLQRFGQLRL